MSQRRFNYIEKDLLEAAKSLESKGYMQLPDCGNLLTKIVVDTERKQFWLVNDNNFKANMETIKSYHKQELNKVQHLELA